MCRQQFRGDQSLDAMSSSKAVGPPEIHQRHLTYASDYQHIRNYLMTSFIIKKTGHYFTQPTSTQVGPDSSVDIETRYGMDGPGIESRWRRDFPHLSRPALGPTQPPIQWVPGLFRG